MRRGFLAALATAALMNGCTTAPYGYGPGPTAYRQFDDRPPPPDLYLTDRDAFRGQRADRDDRGYRRPYGRDRGRLDYDRCRSDDPRDCSPPPDFFVQALPPDYVQAPPPGHQVRRHQASAVAAPDGKWRVQLGAFQQKSRATALRARIANLPALSTYETYLVITGGLTRVQAGPLPSAAAADRLCARVKAVGHACLSKPV